jgi:hypothetical protein
MRALLLAAVFGISAGPAWAQQSWVAFVPVGSATVTGQTVERNGKALMGGSSVVTAGTRTAEVSLVRGGKVAVCQSSSLHVTGSPKALLLALDRGALEVHTEASASDVLMTPDLRFTMGDGGSLDLRLRVTRNGDTCVENKGRRAPTITVADQFGASSYQLRANQHVLFEHGSLREVVDRETSPCGCPPVQTGVSLADSLISGKPATAKQAATQHQFPTAVSEGLEDPSPLPAQATGVTHTQMSTNLSYSGTEGLPAPVPVQGQAPVKVPLEMWDEPLPPKPKGGLHKVGRFFKHVLGG